MSDRFDIYNEISEIKERLARIESKIEEMDKRLEKLEYTVSNNSRLYKFMLTTMIIVLSFVAAVLGVAWKPP